MKEVLQEGRGNKLKTPKIRVWCHPHYIGKSGDDYYYTFNSITKAKEFIKSHKEAEKVPLVAYDGLELIVKHFKKKYPKIKLI